MAGAFDAALKQLLDARAPDGVAWLAPLVGLPPEAGLLHLEAQSSWDGEFPARLLLYNVSLASRINRWRRHRRRPAAR